jgi:ABC-type sugar transport system substrate-binding protein
MRKKMNLFVCFLALAFTLASCSQKKQEEPAGSADQAGKPGASAKSSEPAWVDDYKGLLVKPDGKLTIAHLLDSLTNESSQRAHLQMRNEVQARGWALIGETDVSGSYEANATRRAFERVLAQKPDAIVISYLDIPPIADLVLEARKQGIGVYSHGTDFAPGMLLNVESAQGVMAAKVASYVIQRKSGVFNAVGFIDLWMPRGIRRDIVTAALFEKGGWDVGETFHHNLTPEGYTDELFSTVTNWLTKYGDNLDFVWACWDLGGITAAQAMAAKGFTKDNMFTVGIDGGAMTWAYIRGGEIPFVASLADCFEYQIHTTCEAIKSVHVDGKIPGQPGCVIPANNYITTDAMTVIVDENNVPAVGTNIHAIFNYYGGNPNDPNAWYNQGKAYTVQDHRE